jgi:arylsulfatase A-like enzyme
VELVDLAPTLLEAAGQPVHAGMQGRSLWPLLAGDAADYEPRTDVYCEHYGTTHHKPGQTGAYATMVRTERYKLVALHGEKFGELYDLQRDSRETHNLWCDPAHQAVKLELLQRLCDRMAWTVDPLPLREANY